ncbi:Putative fibronectin domain-containing lipoprotein [hydrothermal vent metagenome]|uniref:Putative fibronectin domain-containing lipoprotein n=1 Tax=hydrothermal vent metagenome TaxID=652676 RepID=A0A1W1D2C6_9ZZZZ
MFDGCNNLTVPLPEKNVPLDKTLPTITLTKHGVKADMNAIALEWKPIDDKRVKGVYIYKHSPQDKDQNTHILYKTIDNRFATHFVDTQVKPSTKYAYSFKTFSKDAESDSSPVIFVKSLHLLHSVVWADTISGLPKSVKLIWRPHTNSKVASYIIERKKLNEDNFKKIAEVKNRLSAEYIDQNLEDNQIYQYQIRVKTFDNLISTPSKILQATTKSLPKPIQNIQASQNLPKQIKLTWDPNTEDDFYQYYVYRSEPNKDDYKLVATLYNNHFTDKIDEDGKTYYYQVRAVDNDGLESKYEDTVVGTTLQKPQSATLKKPLFTQDTIQLQWQNEDKRVKNYIVIRKEKKGWFDEIVKKFKNIQKTSFIDTDVKYNTTYSYQVVSVDKYGIKSLPSNKVTITTPKQNIKINEK